MLSLAYNHRLTDVMIFFKVGFQVIFKVSLGVFG